MSPLLHARMCLLDLRSCRGNLTGLSLNPVERRNIMVRLPVFACMSACSVYHPYHVWYSGTSSDPVSSSEDEDDDILRQVGQVVDTTRQSHLLQGFVDIKKLKDPNRGCRPNAVIQSLEFHPSAYVMLTAGYHKSLDLFQVHLLLCEYIKIYCHFLSC